MVFIPKEKRCCCGNGKNCLINCRWDGVNHIEDELFLKNNLPIRKNCFEKYTDDQYVSILKEICKIYSNSITKKK